MHARSFLSVRARGVALAGVMLLATVVAPLSASAHFMGWPNGHWVRPGTWSEHLHYSRGCSGSFFNAALDAGNNWTSTPTPIYYDVTGNPPACDGTAWYGYVDLYSYNDPNSWAWGWAQAYSYQSVCDFWFFGCWSSHMALIQDWNDHYDSGVIMLNNAKATSTNYFLQVGDVGHEMGHILGLAHAGCYGGESAYCANFPWGPPGVYSIMDYLNWANNKPKQHDYNDVNALYP
jgi:hypothetical protein